MANIKKEGVLLVISSPSGTGKTTICKKLLEYDKNIHLSVSVTTRKKRKNEVEGIDYYFRSKKDFLNLKSQNSFIENALVFENYYGTLKSEVLEQLENGIDVLIDIDWQGTRQITKAMKGNLIKIFLLPPSIDELKKRLSKRHAATNVQEYKEKGFTAQAILNYLSLLGWNPDSDKEIFTDNELIESFQFDQVQKKSAVFDEKKLLWISQQHLTEMSVRDAMNEIYKLNPDWGDGLDWNYLKEIVKLIKDRSKTITEISEMSELFFQESLEYDQELISKTFKEESVSITKDFKNALESCQEWNRNEIEIIFDNLMAQHDVQIGKVMKPIRVALTGIPFGPGIFDLILLLGKDMCLKRLRKLLSLVD